MIHIVFCKLQGTAFEIKPSLTRSFSNFTYEIFLHVLKVLFFNSRAYLI